MEGRETTETTAPVHWRVSRKVKGSKNRKKAIKRLAKSIHDAGWYGFVCWVRYYGSMHARRCTPYRRAGGNGFRFAGTKRFWTDRLYGGVRKGTSPAGWLKEESPVLRPGECQNCAHLILGLPGVDTEV